MGNAGTVNQERMHNRLDALTKQSGSGRLPIHQSLSDFVLGQALHAADELIREHETLTLNEAD